MRWILLIAFGLAGCGQSHDKVSKSLFGSWTGDNPDNYGSLWSGSKLSLAAYGSQSVTVELADLSQHACAFDVESAGTYAISSCSPAMPYSFTSESGTFSVSDSVLSFCPTSGTCRSYH